MTTPPVDSRERFSNRVADYTRYRPHYPDDVALTLAKVTELTAGAKVADIGSGTGISSELLLRHGYEVFAVEPNRAMREEAARLLRGKSGFHSVEGTAEATTLLDASVDLVTAGQAFHWFDPSSARREFARILRPPRWVAVFWNSRLTEETPFLRDYEAMLQEFGTDYREINHQNVGPQKLRAFFGGDYTTFSFPNEQIFDYEGLQGRLLSSSYAPAAGHPGHEPMLRRAREIFATHQEAGRVRFLYRTELHVGSIGA
jgi:SAM-dependent methyltransferase